MVFPLLPILGAILPALGGALLSGIGSAIRGPDKPVETTNSIDFARMRADAEAAGFNPLTALRMGAAAGYGSSITSGGPQFSPLADAFQSFGGAVSSMSFDPYSTDRFEMERGRYGLEQRMGKSQLDYWARNGASSNMSFSVPSVSGSEKVGGMNFMGEDNWLFAPYMSDAQDVEQRYGEPADWLYFPLVTAADAGYNAAKGIEWVQHRVAPIDNIIPKSDTGVEWLDGIMNSVDNWGRDLDAYKKSGRTLFGDAWTWANAGM